MNWGTNSIVIVPGVRVSTLESEELSLFMMFCYSASENDIKTNYGGPAGRGQSVYSFHQYFIWQGTAGDCGSGNEMALSTQIAGVCKEHARMHTHTRQIKALNYTQKGSRDINRTTE